MPDPYTRVFVHCIWSTWDREPLLTGEVERVVYRGLAEECARLGAEVLALGGADDHVHLLVRLPAALSLADIMKQCKGVTSHLVNHVVAGTCQFRWQGAYRAFSVSADALAAVQQYIAAQRAHHASGAPDSDCEPPS